MRFLHQEFEGGPAATVEVEISQQANVMLVDAVNFAAYRAGRQFRYFGGWQTKSPARLAPPHSGRWHVVVDMGGRGGTLRADIRIYGNAS